MSRDPALAMRTFTSHKDKKEQEKTGISNVASLCATFTVRMCCRADVSTLVAVADALSRQPPPATRHPQSRSVIYSSASCIVSSYALFSARPTLVISPATVCPRQDAAPHKAYPTTSILQLRPLHPAHPQYLRRLAHRPHGLKYIRSHPMAHSPSTYATTSSAPLTPCQSRMSPYHPVILEFLDLAGKLISLCASGATVIWAASLVGCDLVQAGRGQLRELENAVGHFLSYQGLYEPPRPNENLRYFEVKYS